MNTATNLTGPDFSHRIPCPNIGHPDLQKAAGALTDTAHLLTDQARGLLGLLMPDFQSREDGSTLSALVAADAVLADLQELCLHFEKCRRENPAAIGLNPIQLTSSVGGRLPELMDVFRLSLGIHRTLSELGADLPIVLSGWVEAEAKGHLQEAARALGDLSRLLNNQVTERA